MNDEIYYLIGLFLFINISLAFMPYWTRKTENFGVTIPESFYDRNDFKKMRKQYTSIVVIISTVLFTALFFLSFQLDEKTVLILFIVVTIGSMLLSFLLYLPFHFKMKKLKEVENWQQDHQQTMVLDTTFRQERLTYSNGWFVIPLLLTVATAAYTLMVYDNIPDQVPMHTSFSGEVTYDDKSLGTVLIFPSMQLFMVVVFFFINYVIKKSKQQVHAKNPKISKQQNVLFRRRWSLYMILLSILMTILFAFIQLTFIYPTLSVYETPVFIGISAIIFVGTIFLAMTTGQGGSRIKIHDETDENVIDRDDDRYWKLGQFYVNKNDPAIFIEKRFGVGWTNNWAHPISWFLMIAVLLLPILIILLIVQL